MITFETVYETLRKEKLLKELQILDQNFLEEASSYLKEKTAISQTQREKGQLFPQESEKTLKQIHSTKQLLSELYERREQKIVNLALLAARLKDKTITSSVLPHEKELYESIIQTLATCRSSVLDAILSGNKPSLSILNEEPKSIKTNQEFVQAPADGITLRFLESVPRFIANDLRIYGPFQADDTAAIPKKTADLLIRKKKAIQLEQPQLTP